MTFSLSPWLIYVHPLLEDDNGLGSLASFHLQELRRVIRNIAQDIFVGSVKRKHIISMLGLLKGVGIESPVIVGGTLQTA